MWKNHNLDFFRGTQMSLNECFERNVLFHLRKRNWQQLKMAILIEFFFLNTDIHSQIFRTNLQAEERQNSSAQGHVDDCSVILFLYKCENFLFAPLALNWRLVS